MIFADNLLKVALKTFVDNVSIQVVEGVLIGDIWSILSPTDVGQMSPTLVTKIAAEHTESQALRQQLGRKLETLRKGMETCRRHSTHGIVGKIFFPDLALHLIGLSNTNHCTYFRTSPIYKVFPCSGSRQNA